MTMHCNDALSVGVVNLGVLSSTYAHIFFTTAYGQPEQVPICPHICRGTPRDARTYARECP